MRKSVSVIIPTFNEEKVIEGCLNSLLTQSYKPLEIIVVDDGSTDSTKEITKKFPVKLLEQDHQGPGPARNLGANSAKGEVLVFVDSDMTFDKDFIRDLTVPIIKDQTIGTFSKNEMVKNQNNVWSVCWNINRNVPKDRMLQRDYPNKAPVYRAIKKSEFEKVGGFDATGEYTDDWSLSRKLKQKSTLAPGATHYHYNPSTLKEVYKQARWIGKNEFISGSILRKFRSLILYSIPISILIGFLKAFVHLNFYFLIFKPIYDFGVWLSVIKSFFGESKAK